MKFTIKSLISISLLLLLNFNPTLVAAATMYKWVDDEGNVYYSDKIPPKDSKQERAIINKQGRTVEKIEAAKTREQIEEEARQAKILAEKQRKQKIQDEKDRVLLSTFQNVESIVQTRDAKIASINNTIQITESTLNSQVQKLRKLTESAAENERAGKKVPKKLSDKIEEAKKNIQNTRNYIHRKKDEKTAIRRKYEIDIKRYKKLTEETNNQ
jgi:hypothetical protein